MRSPKLQSHLIFDENPIVVPPSLAKLIGLNEAIMLQQIHFYISLNRRRKSEKHFREGRWWCWNSYRDWAFDFPFWSESTIRRTFKALRDMGLVLAKKLSTDRYNQTLWYTVDYDALDEMHEKSRCGQNEQIDVVRMNRSMWSERPDRVVQNEQMPCGQNEQMPCGQNEQMYNTERSTERSTEKKKGAREASPSSPPDPSAPARQKINSVPHPQTGEPITWEGIQNLETPEHFIRALADYLDVDIRAGTEIVVYGEALRVLKTDEQARRYITWKLADLSAGSKSGEKYHSRGIMRALREDAHKWLEEQKSPENQTKSRGEVRKTSFWASEAAQKALGPSQVDPDYNPHL